MVEFCRFQLSTAAPCLLHLCNNILSNFCLCYLKHNKTVHGDKTQKKEGNSRKKKDGRKILGQNYLFFPPSKERNGSLARLEEGCSFVLYSKIHNTKTNPGASHYCTKALLVLLGFFSLKKVDLSKGFQLFDNKHIILEPLCLKWLLSIVATSGFNLVF